MTKIFYSTLLISLLSLSPFFVEAQNVDTSPQNRDLFTSLNKIEKSTLAIKNKVDSCCGHNKKSITWRKSITKIKSDITINSKLELLIKRVDSSNNAITLKIDSCCSKSNVPKATPEKEIINNCKCILTMGMIIGIICLCIFIISSRANTPLELLKFLQFNLQNIAKDLPFIFIVWTIGFCLFFKVFCKINFKNINSIGYNEELLLLLSISLILLPFLKTIKIGKFLELQRNIKETKEEIKEFKADIRQNFQTFTAAVSNSINSINTQAQVVHNYPYTLPVPDNKIPELESKINELIQNQRRHGNNPTNKNENIGNETVELFKIRYLLEQQLRRIWEGHFGDNDLGFSRQPKPIGRIIQDLSRSFIIDSNFYGILREILSICNFAIHGEKVSEKQYSFVKENSEQIINYLMDVK